MDKKWWPKKSLITFIVLLMTISILMNVYVLIINPNLIALPGEQRKFVELRQDGITYYDSNDSLVFNNANARETYFTIHNITSAYQYGKGAGIKVGILDWGFAPDQHEALYAGYERFNDGANMQWILDGAHIKRNCSGM